MFAFYLYNSIELHINYKELDFTLYKNIKYVINES